MRRAGVYKCHSGRRFLRTEAEESKEMFRRTAFGRRHEVPAGNLSFCCVFLSVMKEERKVSPGAPSLSSGARDSLLFRICLSHEPHGSPANRAGESPFCPPFSLLRRVIIRFLCNVQLFLRFCAGIRKYASFVCNKSAFG